MSASLDFTFDACELRAIGSLHAGSPLTASHLAYVESSVRTPAEVHAWFDANGISITDWCKENGFDRYVVHDLLRGKRKGRRGNAHRAAVALGLKADPKNSKH